jgi:hypothetical protein
MSVLLLRVPLWTAQTRLAAIGWPVEEEDFGRADEPDVQGCLLIERLKAACGRGLLCGPAFNPPSRRCAKVIR